jgi:biofilm PGA synthesis lipoprotein PgaB
MSAGDYDAAVKEYERLIERFPSSALLPLAQFRCAEAEFKAGNYRASQDNFRLFISNYSEKEPVLKVIAEQRLAEAMVLEKKVLIPSAKPQAPVLYPFAGDFAPMRAVQVMFFEGRTIEDIAIEMKRVKQAGVNTIIFRVFHNKDDRYHALARSGVKSGVYFKSSRAPVVTDILPEIITAAHKNGLKIFAWMTTRYADYGIEGADSLACKGYDMASGAFVRCKGLDLFSEEAVRHIVSLYSELADNDIDGILFQDDLVLRHNEGFGPYARAFFKRETGNELTPSLLYGAGVSGSSPNYTPLFWKWAEMKNRRLLGVASRVMEAVRKKRPQAKFAINLMYESVTRPAMALAWLSQSMESAVKTGFDYYSVMAYHRQMGEELNADPVAVKAIIRKMAADATRIAGSAGKVLLKFQTIDWKTGKALPSDEVTGLVQDIRDGGLSLAVVPYRRDFPLGWAGGYAFSKDN